jgi:hypothetical protein
MGVNKLLDGDREDRISGEITGYRAARASKVRFVRAASGRAISCRRWLPAVLKRRAG